MNDRIKRLREQSLNAVPTISLERALLLTDFYASGVAERVSIPMARALAFAHVLKSKTICINDGELIVGERGPAPKATPTYPEICTHTIMDFEILDSREKIPFRVDKDTGRMQQDRIVPFWSGRSIRDRIFKQVDPAWRLAYEAGVFTEFQEQRAPGHTVLDSKIYSSGLSDFKDDIRRSLESLDFMNDPEAFDKREELSAMAEAADALIVFAGRHAEKLRELALEADDPERRSELEEMARICGKVPARAPETFWEALQYYWFVHLGVITELNTWDSFNPGRLDQHLNPFYKRDLKSGRLTAEKARELLQAFWIKFNNQPAPPKVGVTAQESNTYTDFCLINLGGVTAEGADAANEMTFMILDVIEEMRLLQRSSMVQVSKKSPDRLRRNRRLRQGKLYSDRLFQSHQSSRNYPA
jgi:pyruvate-formate lyase